MGALLDTSADEMNRSGQSSLYLGVGHNLSMRALLVLVVLAVTFLASESLSTGEIKAIEALRINFPGLALLTPPWTSNTSAICATPPFHGILCTEEADPHISGLYEDPRLKSSTDRAFLSPFPALNLLFYLLKLTFRVPPCCLLDIWMVIASPGPFQKRLAVFLG